jgi:hypothetical protein
MTEKPYITPRTDDWECGCDMHFGDFHCPVSTIRDGVLLHCATSIADHNFSHSAWYKGEMVYWLNERDGAYAGAAEILEMVAAVKPLIMSLSEKI